VSNVLLAPKIPAAIPLPAIEPARPIKTVRKNGIGSGPGSAKRAAAPIRKPERIAETIAPNTS
jgi:hypothetical protein